MLANDTEPWADNCTISKYAYESSVDNANRPCIEIISGVVSNKSNPPWASGKVHYQEIRLYPPYKYSQGMFMNVFCDCDCESWKYRNEVAMSVKGSAVINYSNGKAPIIRNPRETPSACKHIVAVLKDTLERFKANEDIYWDARSIEKNVAKDKKLIQRMPGKLTKSKLESVIDIHQIIDTILDEGYDINRVMRMMY